MNVAINGEARTVAEASTLADLLSALGVPAASVATAVNGEFIPRESRQHHLLREGDAVSTFQPITGG